MALDAFLTLEMYRKLASATVMARLRSPETLDATASASPIGKLACTFGYGNLVNGGKKLQERGGRFRATASILRAGFSYGPDEMMRTHDVVYPCVRRAILSIENVPVKVRTTR